MSEPSPDNSILSYLHDLLDDHIPVDDSLPVEGEKAITLPVKNQPSVAIDIEDTYNASSTSASSTSASSTSASSTNASSTNASSTNASSTTDLTPEKEEKGQQVEAQATSAVEALPSLENSALTDNALGHDVGGMVEVKETFESTFTAAQKPQSLSYKEQDTQPLCERNTDTRTNLQILEDYKREKLQKLLNKSLLSTSMPSTGPITEALQPITDPDETIDAVASAAAGEGAEEPTKEIVEALVETLKTSDDPEKINEILAWSDNGRPHWAQGSFDVLLFDVSGLKLAVPLIALGQIYPLTDNLTPIFGQKKWFMGLLPTPQQNQLKTINTALLVMPEKYQETFAENMKFVISLDGMPWGLAVDNVNQPIRLDHTDVQWRNVRTKRPWLAGTVKSAMCALIDIPQVALLLEPKSSR